MGHTFHHRHERLENGYKQSTLRRGQPKGRANQITSTFVEPESPFNYQFLLSLVFSSFFLSFFSFLLLCLFTFTSIVAPDINTFTTIMSNPQDSQDQEEQVRYEERIQRTFICAIIKCLIFLLRRLLQAINTDEIKPHMPNTDLNIRNVFRREVERWENIRAHNDPYYGQDSSESGQSASLLGEIVQTDRRTSDDHIEDWRNDIDDPDRIEMVRDHEEYLSRHA